MDNHERELLEGALNLLHRLLGYADAKDDFKPILKFADDDPNVIPFPGNVHHAPPPSAGHEFFTQNEKNDVVGTSLDEENGIVHFSDKEIKQMPKQLQQLIIVNRRRCRMRKRPCGDGYTYEIRFRAQGYNLSASGKTKELAKQNMLKKLRAAQPQKREDDLFNVPSTFNAFAMHYFENFRKPKVAEQTFYGDLGRYKRYLLPRFKETPLQKITPSDCKAILDDVLAQKKGKTADDLYSLMNGIFNSAIAHGILARNPLAVVFHLQHEREEGVALSPEEEALLLRELPFSDCAFEIALLLFTGLRANELENVEHPPELHGEFIKAVNSKRHNLDKSKVEFKYIPICDRLRPFLVNGIQIRNRAKTVRRRLKKILPNHTLKDLRTTFYTRCQTLHVAEPALKEFMGHSFGKLGNAYSDLTKHKDYLLSEGSKLNLW